MPAAAGGHRYGPVKPGETFWSIATRARPNAGVTMDQVLLSIYDANPKAFDQGRFNGLMKGRVLQIPSAQQMQSVSAADAKARVAALRRRTAASASASAAASTPASSTAVATQPPPPQAGSAVVPVPAQVSSVPPAATITHAAGAPVNAAHTPPAAAGTVPAAASNDLAVSQPPPAAITNAAGVPAAATSAAGTQAEKPTTPVNPPAAVTSVAPPASSSPPARAPAVRRIATPPLRKSAPPASGGLMALFERWRTPLLGVLAIAVLLALLLRRRRPVDVEPADEGAPPTARGIGPVAAVAGAGAATVAAVSDEPFADHLAATEPDYPDDAVATMPTPEPTAPAYAGDSDQSDFDRANATDARTLDVAGEMSTEDALGEADFHLAYGLYDEAINLVQSALVKAPDRQDLQLKLAECYAAAGRSVEFQELAETLHGRVEPAAWEKLAEQGRKLCPGVTLFGGTDVASAGRVDEQAATPGDSVIDFELQPESESESESEPPATAPAPDATAVVPARPEPPASPPPPPTVDLGDFDSFGERSPQPASDNRLDFKLDDIDLSEPAPAAPSVRAESLSQPAATPSSAASAADDGEFATKLDLARAYSDMGDNDAARSLLEEVAQGGNAAQKAEAEALTRQLGA